MNAKKIDKVIRSFVFTIALVFPMARESAADAADVLYGNLGPSGAGTLSATNTDFDDGLLGDPVISLAQGFTTSSGTTNLVVGSVSLGLFSDYTPAARVVSIYPDNGGVPGASPVYTSSAVNVTSQGVYSFPFTNAQLAASTSYWIVPSGPASWYLNFNEEQPTAQNSSGWAYLGTKRITAASPGVWGNTLLPYSVSVVAVPEPSAYVLAAVGVAAMLAMSRRRRA